MRHPLTTTLTLLLVSAQKGTSEDYGYRVADVIENLMEIGDWPDERKADLYALLADKVKEDDSMYQIERAVTESLASNAKRWSHV